MKRLSIALLLLATSFGSLMAANNCLSFDGSNDYVSTSYTGSSNTIEFWFNTSDISDGYYLCGQRFNSTEESGNWQLRWGANEYAGKLRLAVYSGDGVSNSNNYYTTTVFTTGMWYHIAVTSDGSNIKLYVNGSLDFSQTNTIILGGEPNTQNLLIGRSGDNEVYKYYKGKIDEVRVWNDVRTETEIRQNIYRELPDPAGEANLVAYYKLNESSGTTADNAKSTSSLDGTLTNMDNSDWVTSPAIFGPKNCLDFDGSNDYVIISDHTSLDLTDNLTIEAWIYANTLGAYKGIVSKYHVSAANGYTFRLSGAGGGLDFDGVYTENNLISTNTWYHVAVVKNSESYDIYINGQPQSLSGSSYTIAANNNDVAVGVDYLASPRYFDGLIDEVRIWNTARTAAKIRENMCKILTGNESGLVAYYNFDNTSGTTLQDLTGNENDGALTNMDGSTDWISSTAFNTWLNTSSSDWSTAANWSSGSAPASTDNVGIYSYSGGSNVSLGGSPTVNNLLFGGSSTMTLASGVTVNGNLILESNLDLNGQTITLGSSAALVESSGRLYGATGSITTTRSLSNIAENVAGLGAEITTSANMGSTTITRNHAAPGDQAIERKYYINPSTNTGLSATLVFHYDDTKLNGQTESTLKLFKSSDASNWAEQSASTINTSDNTISLTGIDAFSYWTAAPAGSDASLPVELTDFGVECRSNGVVVKWSTESETENLGFIIQRKTVGANHDLPEWSEIASYTSDQSLSGQGSTSEATDYSYTDTKVQSGLTYLYRLGDVDFSGIVALHKAVEITVGAENAKIPVEFGLQKAYPNPFNPAVTLRYGLTKDAQTILQVYNMRGQLVETLVNMHQLAGNYDINWQPQNLSAGVYIVRLQSGNQTNLQKVVFVK